jgi:pimeloyl-ACP methyl ester carboxylesterase
LTPDDAYDSASGGTVVFGHPLGPLVGRFHSARSPVRGAVVLCPPWGYEFVGTYRAFRALADQLAKRGFDVLRYDPDGTGNSWGEDSDEHRVRAWTESVSEAVRFMTHLGHTRPHVVGVRLGATLALLAAQDVEVGTIVLWDPLATKRMVRLLKASSKLWDDEQPSADDAQGLVVAGHFLSAQTQSDLIAIDVTDFVPVSATEVLIIADQTPFVASLTDNLQEGGLIVKSIELPGTTELLDVLAETAVMPQLIFEAIVDWIVEHSSTTEVVEREIPRVSTLLRPADNSSFSEHFVRFGDVPVVAVLTLPDVPIMDGVVIMLNNGLARLVGPASTWVKWSRALARHGIVSLRLDISGLGDSGTRSGQRRDEGYAIEAIDDLQVVVADLVDHGYGPALLAGVCSGAYLSIDAVRWVDDLVGVVSINPWLHHAPDIPGAPARRRRAARPTQRWLHRSFTTRVGYKLTPMVPPFVWVAMSIAHLHPLPSKGVERVARLKPIVIAFWADDEGVRRLRRQDKAGYRRLRNHATIEFHEFSPGDHSLFSHSLRSSTFGILLDTARRLLPAAPVVDTAHPE